MWRPRLQSLFIEIVNIDSFSLKLSLILFHWNCHSFFFIEIVIDSLTLKLRLTSYLSPSSLQTAHPLFNYKLSATSPPYPHKQRTPSHACPHFTPFSGHCRNSKFWGQQMQLYKQAQTNELTIQWEQTNYKLFYKLHLHLQLLCQLRQMLVKWVSYVCPCFILLCSILPKFQTLLLGKETLCDKCRTQFPFKFFREAINKTHWK